MGTGINLRGDSAQAGAALAEKPRCGLEQNMNFCLRVYDVCPGSLVTKSDVLARVAAERARSSERPIAASEEKPAPTPLASVGDLQSALNALGAEPSLKIDNNFGPLTIAAIKQFQAAHDLPADGRVSAETLTALEIAIERPVARRA